MKQIEPYKKVTRFQTNKIKREKRKKKALSIAIILLHFSNRFF